MRVERINLQTITPPRWYSVVSQNNPYMRKFIAWSIFSLLCCVSSQAQIKKVLHKTYSIDSARTLQLDFVGEYEVVPWAGSTVLTETSIELYDANINIFRFFLNQGRYDIDLMLEGDQAQFIAHDKVRPDIQAGDKRCWEIIKLKIYLPEEFAAIDETTFSKEVPAADLERSAN